MFCSTAQISQAKLTHLALYSGPSWAGFTRFNTKHTKAPLNQQPTNERSTNLIPAQGYTGKGQDVCITSHHISILFVCLNSLLVDRVFIKRVKRIAINPIQVDEGIKTDECAASLDFDEAMIHKCTERERPYTHPYKYITYIIYIYIYKLWHTTHKVVVYQDIHTELSRRLIDVEFH